MLGEEDRVAVFNHLCGIFGVDCEEGNAENVARWTPGYVLADLLSIIREAQGMEKVGFYTSFF